MVGWHHRPLSPVTDTLGAVTPYAALSLLVAATVESDVSVSLPTPYLLP